MPFDAASTVAWMEAALPEYLADLQTLVSIDSGTFDKSGVDAVVTFLEDRYRALGLAVERIPHDVYGDSLVGRLDGGGTGSVLLIGHTDTVYPLGTAAQRPFRSEGPYVYGPGTADMKAGDLSILYALRALIAQGRELLGRIVVVHNSDEEIGSPASRELIRRCAEEADAVLVLEAGRESGAVVSARKGIAELEITVRGVAAHAGVNHDKGHSAILVLAHLILSLEHMNGSAPDVTVNVGIIQGGDRVNVVPDNASARLEIRAFRRETLEAAVERAREIVESSAAPGISTHLKVSIEHLPMPRSEGSERLVKLAAEIAERLGFTIHDTATGGASDGNTAAAAGRPVLDGLGPIGGAAHSVRERIDARSIVPRTALLAGLIASLSDGMIP